MPLLANEKKQIIESAQRHPTDTGSTPVQVSLLTTKIKKLTEHCKIKKQDTSTRRGLIRAVNERRQLLRYLKRTNADQYHKLIQQLGLREQA